ncbi:uncharacterized protein HMPREF1541_09223 [Cyphellophora europaea CBS 101466]|uniref:MmgE/PrpD family protein n=1 Tax=Cyphellophora europaea (strain CBS 101466) TaxID=1220924 RepID=W2S9Q2_CYPE1|nr:uncharacterized protein HMPREF1541_09223 [Cyphellophora europaea CBS 101466]ETN45392.1 hypothetical protein HMPREF1541_09223 [Cyphellophora europaea CBS 101466]
MSTNGTHATNGHATNGTEYSLKPGLANSLPITSIIAQWVSTTTTASLNSSMRNKLSDLLLDMVGISAAAAQSSASTPAIVAAITSLSPPGSGSCTVLTKGSTYPAHIAALLNATFGHSLDFDDTHAASTLHPGVCAIWAAVAQAELSSNTDVDRFLLAVSVGYEITCRLGTELGYSAYSRGFHNTSTAGVFGAVAAIAVLKGLPAPTIEMAFGLAGSRAAGSMQYLDNGSHNKRLHPGFACHDAFVCVALAEQGVVGATRIFEGKMGFLNAYSPNQEKDLSRIIKDLGEEWVFVETSLKPFPACRMTHGGIEMADKLANKRRQKGITSNADLVKDVKSIEVRLRTANMSLVGDRTENKVHPKAEVDAQFSAYFQVAHAYLWGSQQGVKAYGRLGDQDVSALCDKIKCVVDDEDPGLLGMGSRIIVDYEDGSREDTTITEPLGEPSHPFERSAVELKFKGCMEPVYGPKTSQEVLKMVDGISKGQGSVTELMKLLA